MTFTLTYVTAIIDIQTDKKGVRNSQRRFENFKKLACQNIPIVLFIDSAHFPFLTEDLLQNSIRWDRTVTVDQKTAPFFMAQWS